MNKFSQHTEWLSLIEISGPFLALPVLEHAFPQGLDKVENSTRKFLHAAYDEWIDAIETEDSLSPKLHLEWIRLVLTELLDYDEKSLKTDESVAKTYTVASMDDADRFAATWAIVFPHDDTPRILVSIQDPGTDLEKTRKNDIWPAPLNEKMIALCRAHDCRLGILTDGERWMLVNAPVGGMSCHVSWYSRLWFQEPITLRAFRSLFDVRRCFGPKDGTLETLIDRSLEHDEEVTDTLGEQVRRAVEVLIQCLDRADADRNRELLRDVSPAALYEAGLTVMMRLVFILCAEERGLLLLGDPVYDVCYAVSTLRNQLEMDSERYGPEVLDRRHDAWARLLAIFRAVYGGVEHESLRMPPLGGSLFDPDRFPFLEGRALGSCWRSDASFPLPIDNRTVLLLLNSLQVLEQPGGALLLSYRALDVEQIGHVYEGLLEHTAQRVSEVTIGLLGAKNAKNPNLSLTKLESAKSDNWDALVKLLVETTKRSETAIRNGLEKPMSDDIAGRLLISCNGDAKLVERIVPFANLLRTDAWSDLIVYPQNSFMVTMGLDRRETGTHYTPKSLTEKVVATTLEPIVYIGPPEGKSCDEWRLKSSHDLLDLKICDPAMGSGAFLVQACRWLGERLVEAWEQEERCGNFIGMNGEVANEATDIDPLPKTADERLILARQLIAERCLYGVDFNPLAVELAKMAIWLTTMSKGRPFGFLDHNLRAGDSLLGIHKLDQVISFELNPSDKSKQISLFGRTIAKMVTEIIGLRESIRSNPVRDIRDVEAMERMDEAARRKMVKVELLADAMMGEAIRYAGNRKNLEERYAALATLADDFLKDNEECGKKIAIIAKSGLSLDLPNGKSSREPFHWALEFPEVFKDDGGFDAIIGNPPFMGGQRITGTLGTAYRDWLVNVIADGTKGSADLVTYFYLRAFSLLRGNGCFGLLAVNTIAEGDTRQVGLERLLKMGAVIYCAYPNEPWPGKAAVAISRVHAIKGNWEGEFVLSGNKVKTISAFLSDQEEWSPKVLRANQGIAFQGSIVLGMGFVLSYEEAQEMIATDPKNVEVLFPYLIGEDLNSDPEQKASRCVINFWDWPEEKAMKYELPYRRIYDMVKPERQRRKENGEYVLRKPLPQNWWMYGEKRPGLYHAIGRGKSFARHPDGWENMPHTLDQVLVCSLVSKYLAYAMVPVEQVFAHRLAVFSRSKFDHFAFLSSTINEVWARKHSSSLELRMNYSPSDAFETLPLLSAWPAKLGELGRAYNDLRSIIMRSDQIGLTRLYNRFHDPKEVGHQIDQFRDLHRQIDEIVIEAYGWQDIHLNHDFYEISYLPPNDRVRYTISEAARIEVLRRLAELNKVRYEEELAGQALEKKEKRTRLKKADNSAVQPSIIGMHANKLF